MTSGEPLGPDAARSRSRRLAALWWPLVLAAAVLPSVGVLDTPLISDDGAALGYVHREGPWTDWTRPQYDLRSVRFWRPLVTTTLGLQERATGVDPVPLRLLNVAGHAAAALLFGLLALRLGGGRIGALVAGLLAAWYPEQGGNVVWIAGRVDSQCVPLLLLACVLALDGRTLGAVLPGFLALATKELAAVLPVWVFLLALARGESARAALRRALPLAALLAAVVLWRRYALGTWVGGYPDQRRSLDPALLAPVARSLVGMLGLPALAAFAASAVPGGARGGRARARRIAALAACALVAALPMWHLLAAGSAAEEHRRTFWLADGAFAVAVGAACGAARGRRSRLALVVAALAFGAWRADRARQDVRDWAHAGWVAAREVAQRGVEPSEHPRFRRFSSLTPAGAYVLHWGVADRFRPPFPSGDGPVWPWRPTFGVERPRIGPPADGAPPLVAPDGARELGLAVRTAGGPLAGPIRIGVEYLLEPGAADPSPRLFVTPVDASLGVTFRELLLVTELGYRVVTLAPADAATFTTEEGFHAVPLTETADGVSFSVREALLAIATDFLLAVDFQTERAYLEVRAYRGSVPEGLVASSPWIELTWDLETLRPALLPLE